MAYPDESQGAWDQLAFRGSLKRIHLVNIRWSSASPFGTKELNYAIDLEVSVHFKQSLELMQTNKRSETQPIGGINQK